MALLFTDQKISSLVESAKGVNESVNGKNLGTVLGATNSSFEPIFMYDNKGNFKGLVSIYETLYKIHFPPTSKASNSLVNPPYLTKESKIIDVVNNMLSLKLHTLPVFDKNKTVFGVIKAKKILKKLIKSQKRLNEIAEKLEYQKEEIIDINAKVSVAYKKLRPNGSFQLIVTDKDGKLEGTLTRDKLKTAFISPSPRQRFSKRYGDHGQLMFDEEEIKRSDLPIRKFINIDVDKINFKKDKTTVIRKVINSTKNSVIIIDSDYKPLGYVSIRDILLALWKTSIKEEIPVIMEKPKYVSAFIIEDIYIDIIKMSEKLNKISPIQRVEVSFKEGKVGIGRPTLVETTFTAKFYSGEDFVATTKDWNILKGVNEALNRMFKKVRRSADKRKDNSNVPLEELFM